MGLLDRFTTTPTAILEAAEVNGDAIAHAIEVQGRDDTIEHLEEAIADLEQMLDEPGWRRLSVWGAQQFSQSGILRAAELCRVMAIANPLIRRGLALRTGYVWGGGVEIGAKAKGGDDGQQDVNAVVQDFLDDPDVRRLFGEAPAQETNERTLGTDGNLFAALFTSPRTGRVRPRLIPLAEINAVIKNPDDRAEPWFYQRISIDLAGRRVVTYHPDVDYQPAVRVRSFTTGGAIGDVLIEPGEVLWDAPILHMKVNALPDWDFGIGDAYAAIAWARAYKEFLEDWAKLVKALSKFAWRVTADRKGAAQRAASRINAREQDPSQRTGAGATAAMVGANLEAIPKTGATIDSESGKPLAAMVASGLDVPVTMLLGDPGVTGARATAETLDTPTENMASLRRGAWSAFFRRMLDYVIDSAVKAPQGALSGTVTRDEWGRPVVTLDGDTPRTIEIDWPDISDTPVDLLMKAITEADAIDKLPPLLIARLVLAAFNVSDADEWIAQVTDDDGNFKPPGDAAGQAAADAFRRGEDPASLV